MVQAVGASFLVNTQNKVMPQGESDVAILSNGNVVVVWTDQKDGEDQSDIRGQLISSTGALIGTDFEVNASTSNPQVKPSVVGLLSGSFAVGWEDALTNTNLEDTTALPDGRADQLHLYGSSNLGVSAGSISEIYKYTGSSPWIFDAGPELFALNGTLVYGHTRVLDQGIAIAAHQGSDTIMMSDPDGDDFDYSFNHPSFAVITGGVATVADSLYEVHLSLIDSHREGIFLKLPGIAALIHVNSSPGGAQIFPRVAAATSGATAGVFVTWFDGPTAQIRGRFVAADGTLGTEVPLGGADGSAYDMAGVGDGRVVVVWSAGGNIVGRVLKGDGGVESSFTVDDRDLTGSDPSVSISGNSVVVSWTEDQGGSSSGDIRARIFTLGSSPQPNTPTTGDDNLTGTSGKDNIDALAGNDTVQGLGGKDTLKGSAGNDSLEGGGGKDTLDGGLGNDTLTGGKGKDFFHFDTKLGSKNIDAITDFNVKDDTVQLDKDIFTKAGALGTLKANAFVSNGTGQAEDKKDRIIYNENDGKLSYDADGNGTGQAVQFATLDKHLTLTQLDFVIV